MPEEIQFTNPVAPPTPTKATLRYLGFNVEGDSIIVELVDNTGKSISHTYQGDIARTLMRQVNVANCSTAGNSLIARVMKKLIQDGVIAGTVGGAPDAP